MDMLLLQNLNQLKQDIGKVDDKLEARFEQLSLEIAKLGEWKAKVMGGAVMLSGLITLIVQMSEMYFNLKK